MIRLALLLAALAGPAHALEGFGNNARDRWTTEDKAEHLAAGYVISFLSSEALAQLGPDVTPTHRRLAAFMAAVMAGAAKEGFDALHPSTHDASAKDFTATALGGLLGTVSAEFVFRF